MGIFDVFKKKEQYKGYTLSNKVDTALQKQLIDRGRGGEINSLAPQILGDANRGKSVANSTPAMSEIGMNSLAPTPIDIKKDAIDPAINTVLRKGVDFVKPAAKTLKDQVVDPVYNKLEKSKGVQDFVSYLNAVDQTSRGELKRDDGSVILTQDLPLPQQFAGASMEVWKNITRGEVATLSSMMDGLVWRGIDEAAPMTDKLAIWQQEVAKEDTTFADQLAQGLGSQIVFFIPAFGIGKLATVMELVSPAIAGIFANSAMTALEAMSEAGSVYKENLEQGKTKDQADKAATNTFLLNSALIGFTNKIGYFGKHANTMKGQFMKLFVSSQMEGVQEFGQEIISNWNTGKEGMDIFEGAGTSYAIGAIIGLFGGGFDMETAKPPLNIQDKSLAVVPDKSFRVEDEKGNVKYFANEKEAKGYLDGRGIEDGFTLTELGYEDNASIILNNDFSSFPFESGMSKEQLSVNEKLEKIKTELNVSMDDAIKIFTGIQNDIKNDVDNKENADQVYKDAVEKAKIDAGQEPDVYTKAVNEAKSGVEEVSSDAQSIYHMTDYNTEDIKNTGFKMGKNSIFGEAAFFAATPNQLYGDNQLEVTPSDFNLKTFTTLAEQQAYIAKQGGNNLSEAIQNEGKYDGFIIPQPNSSQTVYGITNKAKLDTTLNQQQFITTEEALSMREDFKFLEELGIPTTVKNKLMTPQGKKAYGRYSAGMIEFMNNPHKTTLAHETAHAFLDLMLTSEEKTEIINEVKRRYAGKVTKMMEKRTNLSEDMAAEEVLADDFAKYYLDKKKNGSSKKSSSKLRQFYDWFIEKLNSLFENKDKLDKLYKDIETKKPSTAQRQRAIEKMSASSQSIRDLQMEYYQQPENLTTKFLETSNLKNREFVSYQFLKDLVNSKGLPLKEVERVLITNVLETQFKGEKKINLEDFKNAVIGELMPLSIIETDTYADYGSSNVGMESDASKTYIFNSGFEHGHVGHFNSDFTRRLSAEELKVVEIPKSEQNPSEKWAVVKKDVELTEDNIQENVFTVTENRQGAIDWVRNHSTNGMVTTSKSSGLFSHARTFDNTENNISHIAEIQSDSFQSGSTENAGFLGEIKRLNNDIEYSQDQIEILEKRYNDTPPAGIVTGNISGDISSEIKRYKNQLETAKKQLKELEERLDSAEGSKERMFRQYKNIWHERSIREIIRQKAVEGFEVLRFPTPRTVSLIEGYVSEDGTGQIPEGTAIGDSFEYGGEDYVVLAEDQQMGEEAARVAPVRDLRGIFDYDSSRQEDIDREKEDLIYELKNFEGENNAENFAAAVDDSSILSNLSDEEKSIIKKDYKDNGNFGSNKTDDILDKAVEAEIDSRFTDNEGYAGYWFDGLGEETIFPLGEDQLIVLDDANHIETMTFGKEAKDADEFSIDDFDGSEKTVLNFYEKQVNRYLAKLRKGNWELITDENYNQWYETNIMPEDKGAVEAFQTAENFVEDPKKYSGDYVADYVNEMEKDKANLSEEELAEYDDDFQLDNHLRNIITNQEFILKPLRIKDLIASDPDLRAYVEGNEQRYPEGADGLDNPIVVGNWDTSYGVLDGYNRILTKYNNGDEFIEAYVSEPNIKYQEAMEPSKRADLEFRRQDANEKRIVEEVAAELDIVGARETDLSYSDEEMETGYQNFVKLAKRRKWVLDADEASLKSRLTGIDVDSLIFSHTAEYEKRNQSEVKTNDDILEQFKDRYAQEEIMKEIAKEKTPTETAAQEKKVIEKIVKEQMSGKNYKLTTAIRIVEGIEKPITITKKESVLLKNKLRDMARAAKTGAKFGRQEMRNTLTDAFSTKATNLAMMKKAVATYADGLPLGERGKMLKAVANLKTKGDLVKAYARIDAAMEASDGKTQLEQIKAKASKLKKAMQSGKSISVDYMKMMSDILQDYDLSKPTQRTLDKLASLGDFIEANPDIDIKEHLVKRLDRLNKKSVKDLDVKDVKELNDLLGRLWSLGSLKLELQKRAGERATNEAVIKALSTTNDIDSTPYGYLAVLHAPRVADIMDGYSQYKGWNVKNQKKLSRAAQAAEISSKNIAADVTQLASEIKNTFTNKEQAIMAFHLLKDMGQFGRMEALVSTYAEEFGWKSEEDLAKTEEIQAVMDILRKAFSDRVDRVAAISEEIENTPFIKVANYFPIKDSYKHNKTVDVNTPTINQMTQFQGKQTEKGFTFKRVKGVKNVPRIDVFNVFAEAIAEQEYYMHVQPVINEIGKIVNDPRYKSAVGNNGVKWWNEYLKVVASRGRSLNRGIYDKFLKKTRLNLSVAVLGFKASSALVQPTALIDASAYVFLNHGPRATVELFTSLLGVLTIPNLSKNIVKQSPALQLRTAGETIIRELQETKFNTKFAKNYRLASMYLLQKLDTITAAAVHRAMYRHFIREGLSESNARMEADFVMNLTQVSSATADLPLVHHEGEIARTILTFQTFAMGRFGLISHDIIMSAIVKGKFPRKLKGMISLMIILLAGGLEDELRRKVNKTIIGKSYPEKYGFITQSLLSLPASIPVIGNIFNAVVEYNSGFSFPLSRSAENLIRGASRAIDPAGQTEADREKNRGKGILMLSEAFLSLGGFAGISQIMDIVERVAYPPNETLNVVGTPARMPAPASRPKPPALPTRPSMPMPR